MQHPGLGAGIGFDFECVVVLPGDVQAAGTLHHAHRAIGFALIAFGEIFIRVPSHGNAPGGRIDR
jgi:hypothetical protein